MSFQVSIQYFSKKFSSKTMKKYKAVCYNRLGVLLLTVLANSFYIGVMIMHIWVQCKLLGIEVILKIDQKKGYRIDYMAYLQ